MEGTTGTAGAGSLAEVLGVNGTIAHLITRQYMERSVETPALEGGLATTGATLIIAGAIGAIAHQGEQEMEKYLLGLTLFYFLPSMLVLLLVLKS